MHTAELLDHFHNPRNVGELAQPGVTVEANNPACGDILRLSLLAEDGVIREARFKASGCVASIACGSALTELLTGRSLGSAGNISSADIEALTGTLPAASRHAATLALDALKLLLKTNAEAGAKNGG